MNTTTANEMMAARQAPLSWSGCATQYPGGQNVAQLFEEQATRTPDALAVLWEEQRLTYRDLNTRANQLARVLRQLGVRHESVVGVHLERSPRLLVALLAVAKAGGTYLPLDTTYPAERLAFMLDDTGASVLVTEQALSGTLLDFKGTSICLDRDQVRISFNPAGNLSHTSNGESRAYIMYTSGSTGQPKGIEILHRGIARLVFNCNHAQIEASDRVAQMSNCAFDASTWEIWGALLNGACVVGITKETALSPHSLATALADKKVTVLFLTTALFNLMAKEVPAAFRNLRLLLTGGEAMAPELARTVLQRGAPHNFYNVYGPTECTSFATWFPIGEIPMAAKSVPIGVPLQNTVARVLNSSLRPCAVGEIGELHLGGDGLARGYVNRPELTAERFVDDPLCQGERLYKTGDLVRWVEPGVLEFAGRADFQVKIRGFRIELGEVQAVLLQEPGISDAHVLVREDTPGDKRLAAYVVAHNGADTHSLTAVVKDNLKRRLPAYMVPSAVCVLPRLPLTANGKVDRAALLTMPLTTQAVDHQAAKPETSTEKAIAAIWNSLLGLKVCCVNDNFFETGGNSILAAQFVLRVSEVLNVEFPIGQFFENATVAQLARHLDTLRSTGTTTALSRVDFRSDAVLPEDVRPETAWTSNHDQPKKIFLTGTTGFLGAYLLEGLLRRTDAQVYCLVRAESVEQGLERVRGTLRKYRLSTGGLNRVVPVLGSLVKPGLGLDEPTFSMLASGMDAIYHAAAHVSYVEPYALHKAANVDGTLEILRLACKDRATPVHYVSSIGIFGPVGFFTGVKDVYEDTDIDLSEQYLQMDMGYSMSKWVAEKLVFQARDRGLPVAIYRPGFIMGDSRTGATNPDDFMSRLIAGCVQMGSYPYLPNQRKEFVPVDYVANAMLEVASQAEAFGKVFHLTQPNPAQSMDFLDFFDILKDLGFSMRLESYPTWRDELWDHVKQTEQSVLLPLLTVLTEKVHEDLLTRWEVHENMPHFHSTNTNAMLLGSEIRCEVMSHKLLGVYTKFLADLGLMEMPVTQPELSEAVA